jgi:hypothetical protein
MVITAALLVALIYAWRYFTAGPESGGAPLGAQSLAGIGPLVSPEGFLVAWGFTFMTLSVISGFAPGFASNMALLILVSDVIANGVGVAKIAQGSVEMKVEPGALAERQHPRQKSETTRQRREREHQEKTYGAVLAHAG